MEIEIQDNGYNHGGLNRFYITFHWGGEPILSSADISELKEYNFYYTYKFDRLYLWFNETLATHTDFPNVTYTIRMKTLKNVINLTEPGPSDQYIGTTIGVSAASALTRVSVTNINSKVGIGTVFPNENLQVNGNIGINWNNAARIIMNYDNTYRQGHVLDAGTRMMTLFSTSNDTGGGIAFNTRLGSGASDLDYGTERMRINGSGYVGINTTTPYRTLDVQAPARPSAYPFAIGGAWSNRAEYVAKTWDPGIVDSLPYPSVNFVVGGQGKSGWARVMVGAWKPNDQNHGSLYVYSAAHFIFAVDGPMGIDAITIRDQKTGMGAGDITMTASGEYNGVKITITRTTGQGAGVPPVKWNVWYEIYHEDGVWWS